MIRSRHFFAKLYFALALTTFFGAPSPGQDTYKPAPENLKARQDFQDDKFGLFIHWGVYSVLGDGEWVLHDRKLQLHDYERLPSFFDPEKFDAKAWVALAKAAGMGGWGRKAMLITPRGDALPCHAASIIPGLRFDNVKERSVHEIWQTGEAFQKFRGEDWMQEPCKSCDRRTQDFGGCRCQAMFGIGGYRSVH